MTKLELAGMVVMFVTLISVAAVLIAQGFGFLSSFSITRIIIIAVVNICLGFLLLFFGILLEGGSYYDD